MPVTIPDAAARAARRAVERHIKEMPGERLQALLLGDEKDEELEALVVLRQALQGAAERSRPLSQRAGSKSIAIGRHAFDFLVERKIEGVSEVLSAATPRRTLVGVSFSSDEQIQACIEALMLGTAEATDDLEIQRYEQAASRLDSLIKRSESQTQAV